MSTDSTCGLFLRTLFCFCLLMALRAQAGWQGDPPLQNKYREHEFLAACLEGNCPAVKFYLESEGFDLNERRMSGSSRVPVTGLYRAALAGQTETVRMLVAAGAEPDRSCGEEAATPLLVASQNGHADVVSILLEARAGLDLSRKDGVTPLLVASQNGHTEVVRVLTTAGAAVHLSRKDRATPLFMASWKGHTETVRILLAAGADPDRSCRGGDTPLFIASQEGHAEVVRILLEAGANPSISWRLLHPLNFGFLRRTPLTQAKRMKLFSMPGSARRKVYSGIISTLSQAPSRSLSTAEEATNHPTD